jgi:hypothetical protein
VTKAEDLMAEMEQARQQFERAAIGLSKLGVWTTVSLTAGPPPGDSDVPNIPRINVRYWTDFGMVPASKQ